MGARLPVDIHVMEVEYTLAVAAAGGAGRGPLAVSVCVSWRGVLCVSGSALHLHTPRRLSPQPDDG